MTGPATTSVTGVAGIAAAMSLMPFGISLGTLMLGGCCFLLGVSARAGAALFRKLDGTQDVGIKDFLRPIAAILCMIPVAAAASCIVFIGAHVTFPSADIDAGCGGLLLVIGLRGLEGFQWLVDTTANIFTRFVPGQKPTGGGTP